MQILKRAGSSACTMRSGMCQMYWWRMGGGGGGGEEISVEMWAAARTEAKDVIERNQGSTSSWGRGVYELTDPDLQGSRTDRTGEGHPPASAATPWINPFNSPTFSCSFLLFPLHVSPRDFPFAFVINRRMSWQEGHTVVQRFKAAPLIPLKIKPCRPLKKPYSTRISTKTAHIDNKEITKRTYLIHLGIRNQKSSRLWRHASVSRFSCTLVPLHTSRPPLTHPRQDRTHLQSYFDEPPLQNLQGSNCWKIKGPIQQ